ncbi:unnamed protein product [Caenorhabditis brenneri]
MSATNFDSLTKTDKSKACTGKPKRVFEVIDEETNHAPLMKNPKKRAVVPEPELVSATPWLRDKAAASTIPTEQMAKIIPDRLYKGMDPLIVFLCNPCRKFNAVREATEIETGMVQIPLALCTVCRSHLINQKSMKFYQHDCPTLKKILKL